MEGIRILLRYFVNAVSVEKEERKSCSTRPDECSVTKNIMSVAQKTSHEIFLCSSSFLQCQSVRRISRMLLPSTIVVIKSL